MLVTIDTFILERIFTPIAWWFERKTGRTNFYLAWWAFGIAITAGIVQVGTDITIFHEKTKPATIFFEGVAFFFMFRFMIEAGKEDDRAQSRRYSSEAQNRVLALGRIARIVLILWVLFSLFELTLLPSFWILERIPGTKDQPIVALMINGAMAIGLYFADVRRPPPYVRREEARSGLQPVLIRT